MKRKVLIILSDRLNRLQKPHYLELDCDDQGTILKQRRLRAEPKQAIYQEVWENDEGRRDMETCHRFHKKYVHRLILKK